MACLYGGAALVPCDTEMAVEAATNENESFLRDRRIWGWRQSYCVPPSVFALWSLSEIPRHGEILAFCGCSWLTGKAPGWTQAPMR